ncbi:MAG: hypothetical protein WKG00_15930 [Polyangiaceae bacterium]
MRDHRTLVLGHPDDFSHDVLGPAYLHANGKAPCYPYLELDAGTNPFTGKPMPGPYVSLAEREAIEWFRSDLATNTRRMADCQGLLQLESRAETTMSFWDAGLLQFAGDDHAFARGDFSRTYACIQTG